MNGFRVLMVRAAPLAAGLSLLLWTTGPISATASSNSITTDSLGAGTLVFPSNDQFTDFHMVRVVGTNVNGQCRGPSLPIHSRLGEAPIAQIEVAFNPRTCQQLLKIGHVTAVPGHGGQKSSPLSATSSGSAQDNFETQWTDMWGITTTYIIDHLNFSWADGYMGYCNGSDKPVTFPGWYISAYDGPYTVESPYSDSCRTYTGVTFTNTVFCGGTYAYYYYNNVYGTAWGQGAGDSNTWVGGYCTNGFAVHKYFWWGGI